MDRAQHWELAKALGHVSGGCVNLDLVFLPRLCSLGFTTGSCWREGDLGSIL